MATLKMPGSTGDDDLRADCHAVLRVFLKTSPNPIVFDPILGHHPANSSFGPTVDLGNVGANEINSFQLQHVSVEHGLETPDNWDMLDVQFEYRDPSLPFPLILAKFGFHRFTGESRILDIAVGHGL
jgi:hypothetical protein